MGKMFPKFMEKQLKKIRSDRKQFPEEISSLLDGCYLLSVAALENKTIDISLLVFFI